MSTFSLNNSKWFILAIFVTFFLNSKANILYDSLEKISKLKPKEKTTSLSFTDDQLCPHHTVGKNSYNISERAYFLENVTARSGHYPWDIIPLYPFTDKSSKTPKCIFKRLWSKHSIRSDNSSFNVVNITLHSIFQRKSPANLHTGRKCTGFVKFLQVDIRDDIFRKALKLTPERAHYSYDCFLKAGREIENSSMIQSEMKELSIFYPNPNDGIQFKLHDSSERYPILAFVFMVQSATSCFLQVQQHQILEATEINTCTKAISKERLKRVCAYYEECSELNKLVKTINENFEGSQTYDYEDNFNRLESENEGFLDLPTIELFLKGLIFPTLILWAANLGYILLKRRMMRQNSTRSSVTSATAPRYPDFPPPSYEHATCLPTYQEAMMSKSLCPDASSVANSAKPDAVEIEINSKAASQSSLPDC